MIDVGLLASLAILLIVPAAFMPPWPDYAVPEGLIDSTLGALVIGVVVGRITSIAVDDPRSLTSLGDLLIVRSGVEFWPGVAAGLVWLVVCARRESVIPSVRLAALSPPALVSWACYELTCVIREGCPGPRLAFGLRPDGLVERVFPVGIFVGGLGVAAALTIRRCHRRGMSATQVVVTSLTTLAVIRSVASIWLPHIGDQLTRQHVTSLAVAGAGFITSAVLQFSRRRGSEALQQ